MTMKQIFYWLKEQTKTRKEYANKRYEDMMRINAITIAEYERGKAEAYDCVLAMINEVEAMCEKDYCEYIHVEGVGYCSSGCGGYAHDYMLASEWGFCSHCGKLMKIVEVE